MTRGIDYIGVGAGVIIINKDKKIFCHKRGAKAKNEQGKWDMPGGGVEFNEILEEAIVREMIEENDRDLIQLKKTLSEYFSKINTFLQKQIDKNGKQNGGRLDFDIGKISG